VLLNWFRLYADRFKKSPPIYLASILTVTNCAIPPPGVSRDPPIDNQQATNSAQATVEQPKSLACFIVKALLLLTIERCRQVFRIQQQD